MTLTRTQLYAITCTIVAVLTAVTSACTPLQQLTLHSEHRSVAHQARDTYRHPNATLEFFEIQPNMTVVEIWPGASGWYTELLAPYLKNNGKLYAAHFNADSSSAFFRNSRQTFLDKMAATPELYEKVIITSFNPPQYTDIAPKGSADLILTFRNLHNWYMRGGKEQKLLSAFQAFHEALKPGGKLGVVEHRLPESRNLTEQQKSGYMKQSHVIKIAEQAGFTLQATSEINANTKDTANHPEGVWTLPPSLRLGDLDKDKYLEIGESDRMTLLFKKVTSTKLP